MLPGKCSKCLKKEKNICTAFKDPNFQWRNGRRCYGYVDDPAQMLKMYEEMYAYNLQKGEITKSIERVIEYYKKQLGSLSPSGN